MLAFMYGRAFALQLTNGKQIYSMAARSDVSQSLDVLGNTQGSILIRGPKYWEVQKAGDIVYVGATIYLAANINNVNTTAGFIIPWDTIQQNVGNWVDFGTAPKGVIVPPSVNFVDICAKIGGNNNGSGNRIIVELQKNGANLTPFREITDGAQPGGAYLGQLVALAVPVTEGDVLTTTLAVAGDTSVNVLADRSSFAVKKAG